MPDKKTLIVVGTDFTYKKGGIAYAFPGHLKAYKIAGFDFYFVPSHNSMGYLGKILPFFNALVSVFIHICRARHNDVIPIVLCHVGGGMASMVRKFIIGGMAKICGVSVIMQLHGLEVDQYLSSRFHGFLFRLFLSPSSVVIVLTPWWQSRLKAAGIKKRVCVIPNPLPDDWECMARSKSVAKCENDNITLLCLTRIEPGKGVDEIIDAMTLLPRKFKLLIGGTGSQLESLEKRVADYGLNDRVNFCGWVSGAQKQKLFDQADIFCLPSRYDSFGMGYLEAMANGLPVVAYDWGAIPDVVCNGYSGLLAHDYTAKSLACCITKLEKLDSRNKMGVNSKIWVLSEFSADEVSKKIESAFRSI